MVRWSTLESIAENWVRISGISYGIFVRNPLETVEKKIVAFNSFNSFKVKVNIAVLGTKWYFRALQADPVVTLSMIDEPDKLGNFKVKLRVKRNEVRHHEIVEPRSIEMG